MLQYLMTGEMKELTVSPGIGAVSLLLFDKFYENRNF